jgi:maleate isomerase
LRHDHGAIGRRGGALAGDASPAVNTAMLWHALRARGIEDRLFGFGSILREH